MELYIMIGLGIILVLGLFIDIIVDVDTFADDFFSKLMRGKDPHREA